MEIDCQLMYDLRESEELISGSDLHEIFDELTGGEPCPAGRHRLDPYAIKKLARRKSGDVKRFLLRVIEVANDAPKS